MNKIRKLLTCLALVLGMTGIAVAVNNVTASATASGCQAWPVNSRLAAGKCSTLTPPSYFYIRVLCINQQTGSRRNIYSPHATTSGQIVSAQCNSEEAWGEIQTYTFQ